MCSGPAGFSLTSSCGVVAIGSYTRSLGDGPIWLEAACMGRSILANFVCCWLCSRLPHRMVPTISQTHGWFSADCSCSTPASVLGVVVMMTWHAHGSRTPRLRQACCRSSGWQYHHAVAGACDIACSIQGGIYPPSGGLALKLRVCRVKISTFNSVFGTI